MPKTSRSEQLDYKGLEIIADEFTGTFNGEISVDASGITADPIAPGTATDVQGILEELASRITAIEEELEGA